MFHIYFIYLFQYIFIKNMRSEQIATFLCWNTQCGQWYVETDVNMGSCVGVMVEGIQSLQKFLHVLLLGVNTCCPGRRSCFNVVVVLALSFRWLTGSTGHKGHCPLIGSDNPHWHARGQSEVSVLCVCVCTLPEETHIFVFVRVCLF